ncbi:hypothetical protein A6U96_14020 [Agrobacterium tumefaciens]|nr:hypothetical protein A6U96_14020 [Agrobacterium tumefaciens]
MFPEGIPVITEDTPHFRTITTRNGNKLESDTYFKKPEAFLDELKQEANEFSRTSKMNDLVKVGSIPVGIYMDLQRKGLTEDDVYMKRFLNDSDNAGFRTNTLRI